MNPDKLLALVMGKCWHEAIETASVYSTCKSCGIKMQRWFEIGWQPEYKDATNPDYSDPRHRDEFFTWLTKERPEMWEEFDLFALNIWDKDAAYTQEFIPWLFFSDPARPRDLMAEWLQLPEVVERYGWEECTSDNRSNDCMQDRDECRLQIGKMGSSTGKRCLGKVLSDWAREVNNA